MNENILHNIYDCVIKIGAEHLDLAIRGLDAYLDVNGEFNSAIELNGFLESICEAMKYKSIELTPADMLVIRRNPDVKNRDYSYYEELRSMKNRLVSIYEKRKEIKCDKAFNIFPCYEKLISPVFEEIETSWRSVAKCDLPEEGMPVLVLMTNGCIGIDWVNEPESDNPFAHYNVIGWDVLSGNHFEIVRKELK